MIEVWYELQRRTVDTNDKWIMQRIYNSAEEVFDYIDLLKKHEHQAKGPKQEYRVMKTELEETVIVRD